MQCLILTPILGLRRPPRPPRGNQIGYGHAGASALGKGGLSNALSDFHNVPRTLPHAKVSSYAPEPGIRFVDRRHARGFASAFIVRHPRLPAGSQARLSFAIRAHETHALFLRVI